MVFWKGKGDSESSIISFVLTVPSNVMKAIILAAGKGTRLNGTGVKPKCLYEVGGITLIQRQIQALRGCGINDIIVVVGFGGEAVRNECGDNISYIENPIYAETSSLYSLWLARDFLLDGFVVLNSDVLFHPRMLVNLLESPHQDALLISYTSSPLGDEEMKVKVNQGLVVDISKEIEPSDADGENVGIGKFGSQGAKILLHYVDSLIAKGFATAWAPRGFLEFAGQHQLHAISTRGLPWIEIDFPDDYQKALDEVFPSIDALA